MLEKYLTINQLAKLLEIPFYKIRYCHQMEYIPEPEKVGGIRLYQLNDVANVVRYFIDQNKIDKKVLHQNLSALLEKPTTENR
jgi:DNA-binding transcriptional MerR regulator